MRQIKRSSIIATISLSIISSGICQTGPGGIGEKNGQGTIILWLDAAEGVSTGAGNKVTAWGDLSGYNNHAAGNDANDQPTMLPGAINGLPAVKFDGYNDRLKVSGHASLQPDNITILAVVKRTGTTGWGDIISRPFSTSWNPPYTSYALNSCNAHGMGYDGGRPFSQVAIGEGVQVNNWNPPHGLVPDNQPYIHALAYNYHGFGMGSFLNNGLRGDEDIEIIPASGNLDYNNNTLDVSIGTRSEYSLYPYGDHYLDGEIAEIVMFNYDLAEVEHIIAVNYLASKYNIGIGWDQYSEEIGFTTDVIGLGREDKESEQQLISKGGNLQLSCDNFTDNSSYVFAGHNGGSVQGTPISQPSGYDNRLDRVWCIKSKGIKPATVTLKFFLSVNPSTDRMHYGLLYSSTAGFSDPAEIMIANSVNTGEKSITFNVPSASLSDGYYTIGSKVNHWYGISTDWNNVGNWDGSIPTIATEVMVTGTCPQYPVLTEETSCRSLVIQAGGSFYMGGQTLNIYRNFIYSGVGFEPGSGAIIRFTGSSDSDVWPGSANLPHLVSDKTGLLKILSNANITGNMIINSGSVYALSVVWNLKGDLFIDAAVGKQVAGLQITCSGSGAQNFTGSIISSQLDINNPTSIVNTSGADINIHTITVTSGRLIAGNNALQNITIQNTGTLELAADITVRNNWTNNGGQLVHNNRKVGFNLNSDQNLKCGGASFYDIEFNKLSGNITLMDQLNIEHDFTILANGFTHNNQNIRLVASQNQILTINGHNLYNAEISKSGGTVTLMSELVVSNNLTINSGTLVTDQYSITVEGNLQNNAGISGLLIGSNENWTGSLIHQTTGVPATVERHIEAADWGEGSDGWHFVASPVVDQTIAGNWTPEGTTNDYDFFAWDESSEMWLNQKIPENNINEFVPGHGYLAAYQQTDTKIFTGILNSGDIIVTLKHSNAGTYSGWNLLGNPYPSAIDWQLVDKEQFEDDFAYIYNTNKNGGAGYEAIDGSSENALIPAHQGFFTLAKTTSNNQNFTFYNNIRTHGGPFYKTVPDMDILRLKLTMGEYFDETTIRLSQQSTLNRDRMDALKLFGYNSQVPQIYSLAENVFKVAVNSIPAINESLSVPISLKVPASGCLTINISEITGAFVDQTILLYDQQTNTTHNLSDHPTCSFISDVNDDPNRFLLKFVAVGVEETPACPKIRTWVYKNILFVDNTTGVTLVEVVDLTGHSLYTTQLTGTGLQSFPLNQPTGLYLIRLSNNGNIQTIKANIIF